MQTRTKAKEVPACEPERNEQTKRAVQIDSSAWLWRRVTANELIKTTSKFINRPRRSETSSSWSSEAIKNEDAEHPQATDGMRVLVTWKAGDYHSGQITGPADQPSKMSTNKIIADCIQIMKFGSNRFDSLVSPPSPSTPASLMVVLIQWKSSVGCSNKKKRFKPINDWPLLGRVCVWLHHPTHTVREGSVGHHPPKAKTERANKMANGELV